MDDSIVLDLTNYFRICLAQQRLSFFLWLLILLKKALKLVLNEVEELNDKLGLVLLILQEHLLCQGH